MVSKVSANFGSHRSPQHQRKYKKSALFGAKSLRRNSNSNFRCVFYRHSSRVRCILFKHAVTLPGGKPEVTIESHSSKFAFLCSLFRVKHAFEFALILHCYAHHLHSHIYRLHCCAHFISIVIPSRLACVVTRVSLVLRCTFPSTSCLSAFGVVLNMCCLLCCTC